MTDLDNLTAAELRNRARTAGITGAAKMKKSQLVAALEAIDRNPDGHPVGTHDGATEHGCPGCAANATPGGLITLPATLTDGLTVWGLYGGAQIRLTTPLLADNNDELLLDDNGAPQIAGPPIATLAIAFRPNAPRSNSEDDQPYILDITEARALRDLLNTATARGAL